MNRRRLSALVVSMLLGAGLSALGCGAATLHADDAGRGGSAGATDGGIDGRLDGDVCQSDLFVDWQIQSPTGAAVTCDAIHAAEAVVNIDGASYPQLCPSGHSSGSQDILLGQNHATYDVTVNLEDLNGSPLAVPQTTTISVGSCGSYQTPGPAILVVTPPAP
jgi:hypothetical protein